MNSLVELAAGTGLSLADAWMAALPDVARVADIAPSGNGRRLVRLFDTSVVPPRLVAVGNVAVEGLERVGLDRILGSGPRGLVLGRLIRP